MSVHLGAGLVACALTAGVRAEETTYVGVGTIDGITNVVPLEWLPALSHFSGRVKGEMMLTDDGALGAARFETEQLRVSIAPSERSDLHTLIVDHAGERRTFGLSHSEVSRDGAMILSGQILGDGLDQPLTVAFLAPDVVEDVIDLPLGGIGPDVTCSRLGLNSSGCGDDFAYYGTGDGKRAFSFATTSCNVGDEVAEWIDTNGDHRHPVIAQNLFQIVDGQFKHIGQSWLKHSFCAVSENTCGNCDATNCDTLGIGCADTYWATLNDGQDGGAKSDINSFNLGMTHSDHPYTEPTEGPILIRGRLQVNDSDILAGGRFFAEAQYVTHDEPLENRANNASWREVNVTLNSMNAVDACQSSVQFMEPAIKAWATEGASIKDLATPVEGAHVWVGYNTSDNGDGTWRYMYAVQNLNSVRGIRSFTVEVPSCVTVTNTGFHDVDYHSGEPYDGTDWAVEIGGGTVTWSTDAFEDNQFANAIRWGTAYSFWFDADQPPVMNGRGSLGMFRPSAINSMATPLSTPLIPCSSCPGDVNGDETVDIADMLQVIGVWGPCSGCIEDFSGNNVIDVADLLVVLAGWGDCP